MGRSARANRDPEHYNHDRRGDTHFPSRLGYIYRWASTWPSGSESGVPTPVNPVDEVFGGLTIAVLGVPGTQYTVTVTGTATSDIEYSHAVRSTTAQEQVVFGQTVIPSGSTADQAASIIDQMLEDLDNILSTNVTNQNTVTLGGAGTIDVVAHSAGVNE